MSPSTHDPLMDIDTQRHTFEHAGTVLDVLTCHEAGARAGARTSRPGVLIVHTFRGPSPYEEQRAAQVASLGTVAMVADIYGQGVRPLHDRDAARAAMQPFTQDRARLRERVAANLHELQQHPLVDPARCVAIGYCFGGLCVLELARMGAALAGVVSFHGLLDTPMPATRDAVRAKVLVCHGAADPMAPPAQVQAFCDEMTAAAADWTVIQYGHAVHGFTNAAAGGDVASGVAFDPSAEARSWAHFRTFLDEVTA